MMKEIVDTCVGLTDELVIFCGTDPTTGYCRFNGKRIYRILNDLKWFTG